MSDKPYRIQTSLGHRKYLCSGIYMPSVTTVLSATESEKSKAGFRTWQSNNPGALEEASTRGSAIHLAARIISRVLDPGVPDQYQEFWNGISQYLDWFDVFIGQNVLYVLTGTTYVLMIRGGLCLEYRAPVRWMPRPHW